MADSPRQLPRATRFALAGLLVLCCAPEAHASEPKMPGDSEYWVKFHTISAREGKLEPGFSKDVTDYVVWINDTSKDTQLLRVTLDLRKYNTQGLPAIFVDSKRVDYDPLDPIRIIIPLNQSIGPFDKTFVVTVADPTGPQGWGVFYHYTHTDYRIRVRQPPLFEEVAKAESIKVWGGKGQELKAKPPFDPNSSQNEYEYTVPAGEDKVKIKVQCTRFATGMEWAEGHGSNEREVSMAGTSGRRVVSPRCIYNDIGYTEGRVVSHSYVITLLQSGCDLAQKARVRLMMLPDKGTCEGSSDSKTGFICSTKGTTTRVLALVDARVGMYLVASDGSKVKLSSGLPADVSLAKQYDKLQITSGTSTRNIPVDFQQAPSCSQVSCPKGQSPRPDEAGKVYLCLGRTCSSEDVPHCCEDSSIANSGEVRRVTLSLKTMGIDVLADGPSFDATFMNGAMAVDLELRDLQALENNMTLQVNDSVMVEFSNRRGVISDLLGIDQEFHGPTYRVTYEDDDALSDKLPRAQLRMTDAATCSSYQFSCPEFHGRRRPADKLYCLGPQCIRSDQAVCCQIKQWVRVKVMTQDAIVRSKEPDRHMTYEVGFKDGTSQRLPASELQAVAGENSSQTFHVGDLVKVYGEDAVVAADPDFDGMYRVTFADDGHTSYPLPEFVVRRRHWRFQVGEAVHVRGRRQGEEVDSEGTVVAHAQMGHYKVRIDDAHGGAHIQKVPPQWLQSPLAVKGPDHVFGSGEEVLVDGRYHAVVMSGPDPVGRYQVVWAGGKAPPQGTLLGGAAQGFDLVAAARMKRGGFFPGQEVIVHNRTAIIVLGPDDYRRYVVNFEDDSSISEPIKENELVMKPKHGDAGLMVKKYSDAPDTGAALPPGQGPWYWLSAVAAASCALFFLSGVMTMAAGHRHMALQSSPSRRQQRPRVPWSDASDAFQLSQGMAEDLLVSADTSDAPGDCGGSASADSDDLPGPSPGPFPPRWSRADRTSSRREFAMSAGGELERLRLDAD